MRQDNREAPVGDHHNTGTDVDSDAHATLRWHPKISPYRFCVITTTIGIGTTKAVESQAETSFIPITLEWIGGTVVFLVFFILSEYESVDPEDVPDWACWFFEPDCMDIVWWALSTTLFISPPKYTTREVSSAPSVHRHPRRKPNASKSGSMITIYRLLISMAVFALGSVKAILAARGDAVIANWWDWALAVPLATSFYILGLYEYNSSNIWSAFFVEDRGDVAVAVLVDVFYTTFFSIWLTYALSWLKYVVLAVPGDILGRPATEILSDPDSGSLMEFIDLSSFYAIYIFMLAGLVVLAAVPLWALVNSQPFVILMGMAIKMTRWVARVTCNAVLGESGLFPGLIHRAQHWAASQRPDDFRRRYNDYDTHHATRFWSHFFSHVLTLAFYLMCGAIVTNWSLHLHATVVSDPPKSILGLLYALLVYSYIIIMGGLTITRLVSVIYSMVLRGISLILVEYF